MRCRGSLANSPWLLAMHSLVYRDSASTFRAKQLEEEGQWLLLELVGAMGEALQVAHGEAARGAVSWPLEGVPIAELFGPDAVSC